MIRRLRRGGNAVELALVLPVLVAMMSSLVDYGWMFAIRTAATSAARAGARAGALTAQDEDPEDAATTAALQRWEDIGLPIATPTFVAFRQGTPEIVVVRVSADTRSLIGLVPAPDGLDITAAQPMEDQP